MPTLISSFSVPLVVQSLVDRDANPPKIQWLNALQIGAFAYETGALIGRALVDKALLLEKLLAEVEREGWLIEVAAQEAAKRKEAYPAELCFWTIVMKGELAKVGLTLPDTGKADVRQALQTPIAAEKMLESIEALGLEGIGFGMQFPEDTATMYRSVNEHLNHDIIVESTSYGLVMPIPPEPYALEKRVADSLKIVAQYVRQNRAKLEDEFGLAHLLV
ncbi:MAG: hypothetical protein O2826_07180 [Chloroflexi bacterium]|nr:hypothetical protein [Chloroflexota bacterium]MDA1174284.1 hypothetical protein [Chloroflexota bacterium]